MSSFVKITVSEKWMAGRMSVGCVSGLFYIWYFMLLDFMFWIWDLEKVVDISCRDGILISGI